MNKYLVSGDLHLRFVGLEVEADSEADARRYVEEELGGSSMLDYVDSEDVEVTTVESE